MDAQELKARTRRLAVRFMNFADSLPNTTGGRCVANQIVRSGTSIGANYRAACRARSKAEFISKLGIVEEETDESLYWMEVLVEGNRVSPRKVASLMKETEEILKIVTSSIVTARGARRSIRNPQSQLRNR